VARHIGRPEVLGLILLTLVYHSLVRFKGGFRIVHGKSENRTSPVLGLHISGKRVDKEV
jgi:hypothetical protein